MKGASWSTGLSVSAGGADRTGLTAELSKAMARRNFSPDHDRGRVLTDIAVMLADGGEAIADIDVLRHQRSVLGPVASPPTVWRTLDEVTPGRLKTILAARGRVRRHAWAQFPMGRLPARSPARILVMSWCLMSTRPSWSRTVRRKRRRPPSSGPSATTRSGVWCTNTSEFLAAKLRAGNAGSNTAADHIEFLTDAISQVPAAEYSIAFAITEKIRDATDLVPKKIWTPAIDADGGIRADGDVAEITGLLDLTGWPPGIRVIARREQPHPGAQLSLFEERDGWRCQAFVTKPPSANWRSSKPGTVPTLASRTGSVRPRTPDWAGSRHGSSRSTGPG